MFFVNACDPNNDGYMRSTTKISKDDNANVWPLRLAFR